MAVAGSDGSWCPKAAIDVGDHSKCVATNPKDDSIRAATVQQDSAYAAHVKAKTAAASAKANADPAGQARATANFAAATAALANAQAALKAASGALALAGYYQVLVRKGAVAPVPGQFCAKKTSSTTGGGTSSPGSTCDIIKVRAHEEHEMKSAARRAQGWCPL